MPKTDSLVVNTGPIIALVAAMGDLQVLQIYRQVWVPSEVHRELLAGPGNRFALAEFEAADWLRKPQTSLDVGPFLRNTLDPGEAAVIQLALDEQIQTVCIDEAAGRRIARLNGLAVTGSVGVLLRAKREGFDFSMREAVARMQRQGVWLSETVINFAITQAGEEPA